MYTVQSQNKVFYVTTDLLIARIPYSNDWIPSSWVKSVLLWIILEAVHTETMSLLNLISYYIGDLLKHTIRNIRKMQQKMQKFQDG